MKVLWRFQRDSETLLALIIEYLRTQGIYRLLEIEKIHGFEQTYEFDLRLICEEPFFYSEHFPSPMSSYMTGLLLGGWIKTLKKWGASTLVSVLSIYLSSGMQVNFFIELLRNVLLRLGLSQKLVFYPDSFSIFYAFLTGLSLSILRALLQKYPLKIQAIDFLSLFFF